MNPVMLIILRKDGAAWGPDWASDEPSTYTATGTSTGAPPPVGMVTGFVFAARATAMTMLATRKPVERPWIDRALAGAVAAAGELLGSQGGWRGRR